ncbi:potassium-transporting ATPase subunit KdpA [Methylocapsa polymorpha]|uniref:Potassium-transporting ATPase potassium-binding subunit n=1 Tax=Methylocapsa polymorpha TaxID=3080828 RepID=A0ABZ0HTF2_9HYPH|nr:potassium-transporting ATPase subunit KdpA [Methylocapsa sp. RX1]
MAASAWLQIIFTLLAIFLLSVPAGRYMARIVMGQTTGFDKFFDPIDNVIYFLIGRKVASQAMTWKVYTFHMLATNLVMALIIFAIFSFQDRLPLNQPGFPGMEPFQAFNEAISFITNTNWQSYSGESTLSNFSQMGAITFPMFTSAATGFVVAMAWIRAFTVTNGGSDLGNFYRDLIRFLTRVLIPVCFVMALVMIAEGSVQTLDASLTANTLQGVDQTIVVGPVASQGAIELFGTNGGGFYNVNAAHPFQNPTPVTNIILMVLMAVLPAAIVVTFGEMIGNRRQAWVLYGVMGSLVVLFLLLCVIPEQRSTPILRHAGIETEATVPTVAHWRAIRAGIESNASVDQPGGNMEGKEVRFGISGSGLFADITTAFTTGAVNSAHDSYTPLPGVSMLGQMMLQCVFGGKGIGFLNALIYGLIAVFVAGLMVGRTPEFLGKKIEKQEIILVSLALLIHPLVILTPTGWSMVAPYALSSLGNNGIHGFSEILYAFASGAADNGSTFAGLNANTAWFNLALAVVIFIGRYPPIIFLMAVAGSVASKPTTPATTSTLRTDTVAFGAFWLATILIVGALTFFPALVLGPLAEFFAMKNGVAF